MQASCVVVVVVVVDFFPHILKASLSIIYNLRWFLCVLASSFPSLFPKLIIKQLFRSWRIKMK
jgi:hypothetical protein